MAYEVQGVPRTPPRASIFVRPATAGRILAARSGPQGGVPTTTLPVRVEHVPEDTTFEVIDANLACPVEEDREQGRRGRALARRTRRRRPPSQGRARGAPLPTSSAP